MCLKKKEASEVFSFQLCKGSAAKNITAPTGYVVFIETFLIGVTSTGQCEPYHPATHCTVPAEDVQQPPCTLKSRILRNSKGIFFFNGQIVINKKFW